MKQGKRLRIYVGEAQVWQGKPLYRAILELAQREGMAGASAMRGREGFGPEHYLSTERLPDIADNLPVIIDIVESKERVEAFLPMLDHIVERGMITVTSVEIVVRGSQE